MLQSLPVKWSSSLRWSMGAFLLATSVPAQPNFTMDQAGAGRNAYREHCATCHGARLEGVQISPSLMGSRFDSMWRGKSADTLSFHLRRMPPETSAQATTLDDDTYANILAYILFSNGFEAGEKPLPSDMDGLKRVRIPLKEGTRTDYLAPVTPTPEQAARLENLAPVTDETRNNPSPNDWLQWGRSYDGHSHSPLTQVNKENVAQLTGAWRKPLTPGMNMPAPIVHDGIMYMHTFPDTVIALDATNGAVLWKYVRGGSGDQRLGLGLHKNNVIVATSDMHVIALNAKTGKIVWEHKIDTRGAAKGMRGMRLRSAPLVVGDKIMQGITASFSPGGGFVLGIDANTGEEAWRFYTIARPDEPGGDTWNDLPLEKRSGGSVWHHLTYDAELGLVYFGAAPTYDTGPMLYSLNKEGVSNDALFTNCTIALDPDTGKKVWHYQHMKNDQWDLDWAFERQIAEVTVDGKKRKVVMNVGKMAVLEALDAATGEYLFSVDTGVQNVIAAIDPETGEKTYDPAKIPSIERPCLVCPTAHGARSWPPTSYSPKTKMVYLPLTEICMILGQEGAKLLTSGVGILPAAHPDAEDGLMSRLQAIDVEKGQMGWTHDLVMPLTTSVLSTAGGVVFVGDISPSIKAFDDSTGALLWDQSLDDVPSGNIISYSVDDKQYVALVVGVNNLHVGGMIDGYNQFGKKDAGVTRSTVKGGASIWVFALN